AGSALGVDPLALVAQAALESNWGRQVPATEGGSSYNLFGIKADAGWDGRRVFKDTLEYSGGVAERRREPFRAYDSVAHSFEDYVTFLKGHDRYAAALAQGSDPGRYATALQAAGYATDPAYSAKIGAVMRSDIFRNAVASLKDRVEEPIF
ncbi:MAG: glucosaminidase domain-containing protein, partial [Proteobacteria bacterium]|nr:glucosaminidase domain-containing protein [Pseudomonadota bacterium]